MPWSRYKAGLGLGPLILIGQNEAGPTYVSLHKASVQAMWGACEHAGSHPLPAPNLLNQHFWGSVPTSDKQEAKLIQ
jgi:hypothetical protein